MQPRVTDISHHNTVTDLHAAAAAGVWGVIHKATQGTGYRDPTYVQRRPKVAEAGMLWGAYHFGDNSDPVAQVEAFLAYAKPGHDTLLCLDYEDHPSGASRTMRPAQMVAFLREIERRTGRKAVLYSGNVIKENIGRLSPTDRDYVTSHLLWLCQYGSQPKLPQYFTSTFLWQYTDGRLGPQPHTLDDNEDLATPKPPRGSDDGGGVEFPPFLRPTAGGLNVQPVSARYNVKVEVVQRELSRMKYFEVGEIDGKWGGKTAGGIKAFFNDRGLTDKAEMGDLLDNEIALAKSEGWSRPISPTRANATPRDIAPKVEAVKVSLWGRLTAKIGAGIAALGFGGSTVSDTFATVQYKMSPLREFFDSIPASVWFLLMGVVAAAVWYITDRAAKAGTKDYNTGRLN
jgi:lysozyme